MAFAKLVLSLQVGCTTERYISINQEYNPLRTMMCGFAKISLSNSLIISPLFLFFLFNISPEMTIPVNFTVL